MNNVSLRVNGKDYAGWESVSITRTIEALAGSFDLVISGGVPVSMDDACLVLIDGQPVISGYIDDVDVSYDKNTHTTSVRGRDAAGDLVDCALPPIQTKNQTLLQIASACCKPFGMKAFADVDVGAAFATSYLEQGMTSYELLEKLSRFRAVLLTSDGLGNLLITKASTKRAPGAIELGRNSEEGTTTQSRRDRFSEYSVVAQASDGGALEGIYASQPHGTAKDSGMRRYRPTVIVVGPEADLAKRATWERNVRAGRSLVASNTVTGWYADGKTLWQPNRRVTVTDANLGLNLADRLISECIFTLDQNGLRTELRHMPPGAFDLLAVPETGNGLGLQ